MCPTGYESNGTGNCVSQSSYWELSFLSDQRRSHQWITYIDSIFSFISYNTSKKENEKENGWKSV